MVGGVGVAVGILAGLRWAEHWGDGGGCPRPGRLRVLGGGAVFLGPRFVLRSARAAAEGSTDAASLKGAGGRLRAEGDEPILPRWSRGFFP